MFRVVTISRECGSDGVAVARRVAEHLGWHLVHEDLIEAVAERAQVDVETARQYDESVDSQWHRFNRAGLWSLAMVSAMAPAEDAQFFDAETMAAIAQEVILEAAAKGNCVIVGRGAQCVLGGTPGVFHVFVYRSQADGMELVESGLRNDHGADKVCRSVDHNRAAYIRRHFGRDWKDPHLYQMMISSDLGVGNAASMIVQAVRKGGSQSTIPVPGSDRLCTGCGQRDRFTDIAARY